MITTVVNLFGGPGSGKTTTAAGLFAELKARGHNVEFAHEYAKELCWEKNPRIAHQLSIFAEQSWRIQRLDSQVEFVITDSPLLLSLVYGQHMPVAFHSLVMTEHKQKPSFNVFIQRVKPYQPAGRYQDESGAIVLDLEIRRMLDDNRVSYCTIPGDLEAARHTANLLTGVL